MADTNNIADSKSSPLGAGGHEWRLIILGAGESGIGAALLGKQKGYHVFVSDGGAIKNNYKQELIDNGMGFVLSLIFFKCFTVTTSSSQ